MSVGDRRKLEVPAISLGSDGTTLAVGDHGASSNIEDFDVSDCIVPYATDNLGSSTINVENSSDVVIGPVTQFHGPVTILQNIAAREFLEKKPIANGVEKSKTVFYNEAKLVSCSNETTNIGTFWINHRRSAIWLLLVLVLFLIVIAVVTVLIISPGKIVLDTPLEDQEGPPNENFSCNGFLKIYKHSQWGGIPRLNFTKPLAHPVPVVLISHTAGVFCKTFEKCAAAMQSMQSYHMATLKSPDIGYNFVIGADGCVYEGRGWNIRNMHVPPSSIGISFTGNFIFDVLSDKMIAAAQGLIALGVELKKLSPDYKIVCDNQTYATLSPGENVYKVVKMWKHFYPGVFTD